jgi:beta-glucuronidase
MLYPRETQTREIKDLNGIWEFRVDSESQGRRKKWYAKPLTQTIPMPVPASYNDITQDIGIRHHVGDVWYERTFFVSPSWEHKRIVLRVGSATHHAVVWVNGKKATEHKGGFLPFEADVSDVVEIGEENRLTVVVNNVLDWTTLPPGEILDAAKRNAVINPGAPTFPANAPPIQDYFHGFFNYAGIHRPVLMLATNKKYVAGVKVNTEYKGTSGRVDYTVKTVGAGTKTTVRLVGESGRVVATGEGKSGTLAIKNVRLWKPGKPYLYKLIVDLHAAGGQLLDTYWLHVGVRTVQIKGKQFLINGKPFYFKGFGKHEDADIRGKGLDHVVNVKDMNLLKWIGANSFRTSHYPYAEEIMDLCDRLGIVVIDESPAVGLAFDPNTRATKHKAFTPERFGAETLKHHRQVMKEMIDRDSNHPCVVMWSVSNEAAVYDKGAVPYFRNLANYTRKLDPHRPVTNVMNMPASMCRVSQFFDVVSVNSYYGWYWNTGELEYIDHRLSKDLKEYYRVFKKPVILAEYGTETIPGLHTDPPQMFTEEYQCEMLTRYHEVLDKFDFVIGEHVWCFADFMMQQHLSRVMGCRKGVFTRQRDPKAAAHMLRKRWRAMKSHPPAPKGRP